MSKHAIRIACGLKEYGNNAEIIVIDDGSSPDHTGYLAARLTGPNEFVLHFNDLFSTLTVNRAVSFARGEFVVKLQDDDIYPGVQWIHEAVLLFRAYPDMAVLGGRGSLQLPVGWNFRQSLPWRPYCQRFQFVPAVNEAPLWFRRTDFLRLGGYDEGYAPYYWSEQELCFKAWLAGKSVGWYPSGVERCAIKTPERRKNKQAIQHESWRKNSVIFERQFAQHLRTINEAVAGRNYDLRKDST